MLIFTEKEKEILKPIYNFTKARKVKLFLVGGALRDLILNRKKDNPDFDFCLKRSAISFGRALAKKLKAGFVVLDEEHAACRIVKKIEGKYYTFDFTDFRAATLEKDLLHRDFTINSLAVALSDVLSDQDLNALIIDPYSGREDLKNKIIRATHKNSFQEDPLRILRAFSFSCMLGFVLSDETKKLVNKDKQKISSVSSERIRDELFKVFDSDQAYAAMATLDKLKILELIFPEIKPMRKIGQGPYHHLDVWQHTLETLSQFEVLLREASKDIQIKEYLDEQISSLRKRSSLIKFACILHDVGKPKAMRREKKKIIFHGHERVGLGMTRVIARRLKLSNDECHCLERIVLWHLRPGYLADNGKPTERAIFRYFRDSGTDALAVLLLSLADQRATKGPLTTALSRTNHEKTVKALISRLLKKKDEKKLVRLLSGNDLMRKFKLSASPLIGKVLSELEEAQAVGKVKNKIEAFKLAAKIVKKGK
ncbi:MAG: HD domain-containing protein [Candidatus Omnitrophica bacterium]|nr:HD domain-containing protein [Candidatus Omnitrophota bacterium]